MFPVLGVSFRPPVNTFGRPVGGGFPGHNDLVFWYQNGVDTIGLSTNDYANVDASVRDIFFVDESTLVDTETAYATALASPLLNEGTMIGTEAKGVVLYAAGTDRTTLNRALRYFGLDPVYEEFGPTWNDSDVWNDSAIWSE